MSRQLLCAQCGAKWADGAYEVYAASSHGPAEWARVVRGHARMPQFDQRVMHINGEPMPLSPDRFDCDLCGREILPGHDAVYVTFWSPSQRIAPPVWEDAYVKVPL